MAAVLLVLFASVLACGDAAAAFHPNRISGRAAASDPSLVFSDIAPLFSSRPSEAGEEESLRDGAATSSREDFLRRALTSAAAGSATASLLLRVRVRGDGAGAGAALAFEGGVGGLGKTRPETGIVFRDPDAVAAGADAGGGGDVTNELLAPDGTPALVTFRAPWPMLRSSSGIESRDLANPEAAFVQAARIPAGCRGAGDLPKSFFAETVFGQRGKFGAYGAPSDIRVKRLESGSDGASGDGGGGVAIYAATFTTLTPAMRESERRAYISASVVGDGVFMLVTGTTAPRFRRLEKELRGVAESFACVAAPKSSLRSGS